MTSRRIYDNERHVHFITFSCYKRRKLLDPDRAKRIVIGTLASRLTRQKCKCVGFVVMPNHVHVLLWFEEPGQLTRFLNRWKENSSARIKELFQRQYPAYWSTVESNDAVWQPRYYDFNVLTEHKIEEKLDYMHLNPVRAKLVDRACDWLWSSARWYLQRKSVGVPIEMPPL